MQHPHLDAHHYIHVKDCMLFRDTQSRLPVFSLSVQVYSARTLVKIVHQPQCNDECRSPRACTREPALIILDRLRPAGLERTLEPNVYLESLSKQS